VLVIDNASTDGTSDVLARYSDIIVRRLPRNAGFAGGIDAALPVVETPFVALLNDDADAEPNWLAELEDALDARADVAAATSQILLRDGRVNNAGVGITSRGWGYDIGFGGVPSGSAEPRSVFGFCGAAALLRTEVVRAVGGFPARFFLYYEDTDTSWRLRLDGWDVHYVPSAIVHHSHGASSEIESRAFARWNEGNRLRMLIRCAPAAAAARAMVRHLGTTTALVVRAARGKRRPEANLRPMLRLKVWLSITVELAGLLGERRRIRASRLARRDVWTGWAGRG
jgi:GT2 family glycosyltransferase